jgi:hypothetical protein
VEVFLAPGENIRYRSPAPVEYQGDSYDFYITDRRLMWHKRTGLVFKKDKFTTEVLENVTAIKYSEKGIINKKGLIEVHLGDRTLPFQGQLATIRAIYSHVQALMQYVDKKEPVHVRVAGEPSYMSTDGPTHVVKEIVREVVKVPCKHCGTLVLLEAGKCPKCGSKIEIAPAAPVSFKLKSPKKEIPSKMDERILNYVTKRGGTISISEAASHLKISVSELEKSIERLKQAGKLEEE